MLLVYPRRKQASDICQYWLKRLVVLIGSGVLTPGLGLPGEFAYSKHLYGQANMQSCFTVDFRCTETLDGLRRVLENDRLLTLGVT